MLRLEGSGICDICFNGFSGEPGSMTAPHSIPCGHVFCKTCLVSVIPQVPQKPRACPLCRHPFALQTIRKIHMAPPTTPIMDAEMDLIRRFTETIDCTEEGALKKVIKDVESFMVEYENEAATISRVLKLTIQCESLKNKYRQNKKRLRALEVTVKHLQETESLAQQEVQDLKRQADLDHGYISRLEGRIMQLEGQYMAKPTENALAAPPEVAVVNSIVQALRDVMDMIPSKESAFRDDQDL